MNSIIMLVTSRHVHFQFDAPQYDCHWIRIEVVPQSHQHQPKEFTMGDNSPKAKQKSQKQGASAKAQKKANAQKFVPAQVSADVKKKR